MIKVELHKENYDVYLGSWIRGLSCLFEISDPSSHVSGLFGRNTTLKSKKRQKTRINHVDSCQKIEDLILKH